MVVVGIDLGTTYSCVAVWNDGTVEVIPNEQGNRTTPSYVSFTQTERLIGEAAKNNSQLNPQNTIFASKRLIGRRYDDIGVQMDLRHWPFKVMNDNGKPKITVEFKGEKKTFAPEEVSGMILFRMKQIAEAYLGKKVVDAVVTVPAYFNDAQRQATRSAGAIAGLNILRIINEPTAAAMAYGLDRNLKGEKNILIYDLGGGTLDVSVLTISKGSVYKVKSTAGNTRLGGEDFDSRLVAYFSEDFRKKYHNEVLQNPKTSRRLRTASERAKRALTSATTALVDIEALSDGIDYSGQLTRDLFEELCSDLFEDTLKPIGKALSDARMTKSDIHEVVLIGGSTRIPKIRSMVQSFFNGLPLSSAINPDEAVAYGAAIQAAILSDYHHNKVQDLLLIDVVPLSLGVETARGMMYKVIEKNTPIPCRHTKDITTLEDHQRIMTIEVFEGERSLTKDNNLLGVFELKDIPPAPRGVPKVDVTFDVDVNGILTVSAQDRSTGNKEGVVINNSCRLKKDEIKKMITDAMIFEEEDKENKLRLEARNQMENYVFGVRQTIADRADLLTVEEAEIMKTECKKAVNWLDTNSGCSREKYEQKMAELLHRWSQIMKKFYTENWKHIAKRARSDSYQSGMRV